MPVRESGRGDTRRIAEHPVLGRDARDGSLRVTFDGRSLPAREGESIASMLRAHGVVVLRTMPDSDAPRGVFCGVGRCPDCMMTVDGELNVRACVTRVRDGMVIRTQRGLGHWEARR